jgi:hypothetical protein
MRKEGLVKNWYSTLAIAALMAAAPSRALTQGQHSHAGPGQELLQGLKSTDGGALVRAVREATERFKNVRVAENEDYHLLFGCVSGPDAGAMGMHFVNRPLLVDGVIDASTPEIVIYEPQADGSLKLIGADYLVFADQWNATHTSAPELMGQQFHLFEAPNRFGLPTFYTLHVWAWKDSPTGTFVNWNTNVSCNAFSGQ